MHANRPKTPRETSPAIWNSSFGCETTQHSMDDSAGPGEVGGDKYGLEREREKRHTTKQIEHTIADISVEKQCLWGSLATSLSGSCRARQVRGRTHRHVLSAL